ncbi:hypothetical protein [Dyadobacter aurulentus]|uniref:hypothetical protein n=1 Tax=Dyadobacter sp. UC 10 TaxID=2605428 RepID=UPI0011F0D5A8|nr:hypothetical protein [Dyadobacter sp. UC 10]KAA0992738.1 hypothetical protein FXO21_22460 [Dyadobacter sp. UC 10]
MEKINITIFETLPGGNELAHPISLPEYLLPQVGDELYLAIEPPLTRLKITSKRIVCLKDDQYHIAYTADRVEEK